MSNWTWQFVAAGTLCCALFGFAFIAAPHSCEWGLGAYVWTGAGVVVAMLAVPFLVQPAPLVWHRFLWSIGFGCVGLLVWLAGLFAANVRIICRLMHAEATDIACDWLVCMTEKDSGSVRVGCGRYDWMLQAKAHGLASRLVISIEAMQVLAPDQFEAVFAWVRSMDYPWTSADAAVRDAPQLPALAPVLGYLARGGPG